MIFRVVREYILALDNAISRIQWKRWLLALLIFASICFCFFWLGYDVSEKAWLLALIQGVLGALNTYVLYRVLFSGRTKDE